MKDQTQARISELRISRVAAELSRMRDRIAITAASPPARGRSSVRPAQITIFDHAARPPRA